MSGSVKKNGKFLRFIYYAGNVALCMAFWLLALPYFRMYNRRSSNRGDLKYEKGFAMEGMDVLGYLKSRQNELERVNHPLAGRSLNFRYLYSYGVGVLALGSMKSMTELQDRYDYFLECIALPREERERIITDINNHFEFRLIECIRALRTKAVQYCFLVDLYRLYNIASWSADYCKKVIENYIQMFHTSEQEILFFEAFNDAVVKRDVEKAKECYHRFRDAGFDISYALLKYFFPHFIDEDTYESITVEAGKTLLIDKPAKIRGNIIVERGGSLLFDGADVTISGAILIDGGRVRFRDTKILVEECGKRFFLTIQNAAVVRIEDSSFDCNMKCGFLRQNAGRLLIEESEFRRSAVQRMMEFSGTYAEICRSSFSEGENGFILASGSSQMQILNCDFYQAHAEYGGAFFSDSIDNILIQECSFRSCSAKYLGTAVYFKYQKLGQVVRECTCRMCGPEGNAVFNVYQDDFELRVR